MRIVAIAPHTQLRPYVLSYRIVEDRLGEFAGQPIWTCPELIGGLSVNFGQRSDHESWQLHPKVGLLGIQTRARRWIAQPETLFVMATLTVPGMMALFPHMGKDSTDNLLDVADVWGDRQAEQFWRGLPDESPQGETASHMKSAMDSWLLNLLSTVPVSTQKRCVQMHQALTSHRRIDTACQQLGITPRTLQRDFQRHLGISPKQVMNLYRLQRSIRASVDTAPQAPLLEFADQAHEIRTWRRYLDQTPGRYGAKNRSALAHAFAASAQHTSTDPTLFYL